MDEKFKLWKNRGFYPDIIYDIGAHHGYWTKMIRNIYELSSCYLFEACDDNTKYNNEVHYFNVLLGKNNNEETEFYMTKDPCNTGNSIYQELSPVFINNNYTIEKKKCVH